MRLLSLFLVLFFSMGEANAQVVWQQSSGPEGGNVRSVAASLDGTTVVAGFWGGKLFRAVNGGAWMPLTPIEGLQTLSAQGNIFYAQSYSGLFQSYDFGNSWMPVVSASANTFFSPIVRGRDGLYFIANDSVYRSTDAGDNWNYTGSTGQAAMQIGYSGKKSNESALIASGGFNGIFRSTDRGATWTRAEDGLPANAVTSSMVTVLEDGEYSVWVCVQDQGVYYTDNGGKDWDKECDGLPEYGNGYPNFTKLVEAKGKLFGVTEHSVYEYSFAEEVWKKANHLLGKNIQAFGSVMYSSSSDGVEYSGDGGLTWQTLGSDMRYATIGDFASSRKAVLAAAQNGVFRSVDDGLTWTKTGEFYTEDLAAGHGVAYAESLEGVRRSLDDGITWNLANTGIDEELYHLSTVSANSRAAFAGFYDVFSEHGISRWNSGGIFRSTDNGATWMRVNSGLAVNDGTAVPIIKLEAYDDLQLALTLNGLYRSTNDGDSWSKQAINFDASSDRLLDVARSSDTIVLASMRCMFRSLDAGKTWSTFASGLQSTLENHQALLQLQDTLVLKSYDMSGELHTYRLDGEEWVNFDMDVPAGVEFTKFFTQGATLYAGSNERSIWTRSIGQVSTVRNGPSQEMGLSVYPNPVTDNAAISFTLELSSPVQASLYDLAGRMVLDLVRAHMPQGLNTIAIDAASTALLPAGAYYLRIMTDTGIAEKQVVLLR
jgi:hypothetical protein